MRPPPPPPPPPRKGSLQGGQGPTARREETAVPQMPPLVSAFIPVVTQALPQSPEPRRKRNFKLFALGLTIAGCGLLVLAVGALAIHQELGYELRQLVAEYEAKKRDLVAEYQAKKRELETEYEAKKRELTTELETDDAKKRELVTEYEAKTHKLVAEYQTKKDRSDAEMRQAIAEYKRKEEQLVAEYDRRLEAIYGPNGVSADPQKTASIFDTKPAGWAGWPVGSVMPGMPVMPVAFGVLSPDDLYETERLGSNWRDKVDWNYPSEDFGKLSRPDRVEALRYQYFVDGDDHPITPAEVEEYLALPFRKRMAVCSLSRRRLLTMRDAGVDYPPPPPNGRAAVKDHQASPSGHSSAP